MRSVYDRLADFLKEEYRDPPLFLPEWEEWRELVHRHRLEMHFRWDQILAACGQMSSLVLALPSDLAAVGVSEVHALATNSPFPAAFRAIWSIARSSSAATSSDAEYLAPAREMFTQNDLVLATRQHSEQYAFSGELAVRNKPTLRAPRAFSKIGQALRARLLKSSAIVPRFSDRYIKDATQANLANQAKGRLPGMAPSSRFYTAFCGVRKPTPFPVLQELVIQRRSVFKNTASFWNYVSLGVVIPPSPPPGKPPREARGEWFGGIPRLEPPLSQFYPDPAPSAYYYA